MNGTTPGQRRPGQARAQTAQDFAVGISIFLLAVGFVFAFVPTAITPLESGTGASEAAQADRTATIVVGNLSVEGEPNHLAEDAIDDAFSAGGQFEDAEAIRERTGLPFSARVNVTVENVTTGDPERADWTSGNVHREGQPAAAASRIVRTDGQSCDPACRIVVRVW